MEHVVVVTEDDDEIGTMPREEAHRNGTPHRIAVTYVENSEGKILVQIRARGGAHDHSSAGHVEPGESYLDAATRELEQELGIAHVELRKIGHGISRERPDDGSVKTHLFDVFVCLGELGELQASEVSGTYWADPQELMRDMSANESSTRYAGGFRASLLIYLEWRDNRRQKQGI